MEYQKIYSDFSNLVRDCKKYFFPIPIFLNFQNDFCRLLWLKKFQEHRYIFGSNLHHMLHIYRHFVDQNCIRAFFLILEIFALKDCIESRPYAAACIESRPLAAAHQANSQETSSTIVIAIGSVEVGNLFWQKEP